MRPLAVLLLAALVAAASPAASAQATGEGITVAVLDSGVDGQHPELAGRVDRVSFAPVVPGLPVDVGGLASPDPNGQGTAVASLIAGSTLGLAPGARILDLQVSPASTGTQLDGSAEAAAIEAMDYLLQDPGRADVVVLSFAARGVSSSGAETLAGQVERLRDEGVLVLVPAAPALSAVHTTSSAVTVGAPDCPASSGRQSGADQALKPDLVAPASNLQAAAPGTALNPAPTRSVSGTQYAAALVAGAAALVLDERAGLPADAAAAILRDSAEDIGEPGVDACNGFGLLSPNAAVLMAGSWVDPEERFPTKPTPAPLWLAVAGLALGLALARRKA